MRDDRPAEADGGLGRAAFARLADRLARLPTSHPSSPGYPAGLDHGSGRSGHPGDGDLGDGELGDGDLSDGDPGGGELSGGQPAAAGGQSAAAGRRWPREALRGRDRVARGAGAPEHGREEPSLGRGRPGGHGRPSLRERLPRLPGPAPEPARGHRPPSAGLGPRPRGEPYRPWFGDPGEPWFAAAEDRPRSGRRPPPGDRPWPGNGAQSGDGA